MADLEPDVIGCCGLSGINNLSDGGSTCGDPDCDAEDCQSDSIATCTDSEDHKGIIIATTNAEQEENGIGRELERSGFHAVLNTHNNNSGNRITLWVKDHTEGKVPTRLTRPAPQRSRLMFLQTAVTQYMQSNPNPRSTSAQRLVNRYRELFPE